MIELEGITAGYGETVVLRDVSLSVPDSGVVALLGPNGAGKTTTLRAASGLIKPISGRVLPSLTVKENIVLNSPKGKERESLVKAGEHFPVLAARLGQQAGSLSGGEQQMLSLVRAYLTKCRHGVHHEPRPDRLLGCRGRTPGRRGVRAVPRH